jgi:glycosyltransferase involved in cell wall biosynthesis
MRIAQIAPLAESVPPTRYGGTERVVSWLTEELVQQGHDVTLFASGDSQTAAHLVPIVPRGLRLDNAVRDHNPYHLMMLDRVQRCARDFDVLHFHVDLLHYPIFRTLGTPFLTTLHGRLDLPDLHPFYRAFSDLPLISISNHQRKPMPPVNWVSTIYHGLPKTSLRQGDGSGGYLAFLGRISPEKGPEQAIEIAKRSGMKLKIAAKVDNADREYYETRIKYLLDHPLIEFIGEIGDDRKNEFLGNASALLFPICWPEPFGLVMIEAMASGTPVIAFNYGSVPEVMENGVTGFVVGNVDEAVAAAGKIGTLDRNAIRALFERRFSSERMAQNYLEVYNRLMAQPASSALAAE